jgi:hypothetical protein
MIEAIVFIGFGFLLGKADSKHRARGRLLDLARRCVGSSGGYRPPHRGLAWYVATTVWNADLGRGYAPDALSYEALRWRGST